MGKMGHSPSSGCKENKKYSLGGRGRVMNKSIVKLYSCSSRARGLLNDISFFFIIIGL
jgi:hypothetical protein